MHTVLRCCFFMMGKNTNRTFSGRFFTSHTYANPSYCRVC